MGLAGHKQGRFDRYAGFVQFPMKSTYNSRYPLLVISCIKPRI